MRLSRPITTWATTSIHSRAIRPADELRFEDVDRTEDFPEQRFERLIQDLEPRNLGIAQVDDHAGAVGGVDPRLAQRITQAAKAWSAAVTIVRVLTVG